MVKHRRVLAVLPALMLLTLFLAYAPQHSVHAADIQYHLEKQWVKIWVNTDGTIDLQYTIHIICDQGRITYVFVGQPSWDFTIGEAYDSDGHALTTENTSEGSDHRVKVYMFEPLTDGQAAEFTVITNVGHVIYTDETNPGNAGFQFTPTWWSATVNDLMVLVVLPAGVSKEQVKVTPDWEKAYTDTNEGERLVIFWERKDLAPETKFQVGISFPATYVEHYETTRTTEGFLGLAGNTWYFLGAFAFIVVAVAAVKRVAKKNYADPRMLMESLGIRRGLTAVEASYLIGVPPAKVVVMILYSLLLKHAVWVSSTKPNLKLQITEGFDDPSRAGEKDLRYYEQDFLHAIKTDGTLDEKTLADTFMRIRSSVESTLRGFCREDTIAFYKKTVQQAWEQVERAGAPDVSSKMFDENLLWLMLDEDFRGRTETSFKGFDFQPLPFWWWYWFGYTQFDPNPIYNPATIGKGQPPATIPGSEFANNIATSLEKTAGNFVASIEKFTNSILPAPPPPKGVSRQPVHHEANCACACVSCACVCACVSCACACASGGVG